MRVAIIIFLFIPVFVFAQIGGSHTYSFLNLPNSARASSMGGTVVSLFDNDLDMCYYNPSLLNSEMSNFVSLNFASYYTTKYGYAAYAKDMESLGTFSVAMHYVNYGDFIEADETGTQLGHFTAAEYALNLTWAYKIDSVFTFGANLKPVYSDLYLYNSTGILSDFGITYYKKATGLSAALVIKNLGMQITTYNGNQEPMPFEIQMGVTKKLAHAPFRISLTAIQLQKYDLTYDLPQDETLADLFVDEPKEITKFDKGVQNVLSHSENILRHAILGVEFVPSQNFNVRLGYNFKRRKELAIVSKQGMVGFSMGVGMKISKFRISYGRATYHLTGATNTFSISTNISEFYR